MPADPTFLTAFQYASRTTGIPTNAISRMSTECWNIAQTYSKQHTLRPCKDIDILEKQKMLKVFNVSNFRMKSKTVAEGTSRFTGESGLSGGSLIAWNYNFIVLFSC